MRRTRKCVPIRGTHSIRYSSGPSQHLPRSPLQDRPKLLVPHVAAIVAEAVLVQVALQILGRNRVIDSPDSSLNQHPESLDRVGVRVPANVLARAVLHGVVNVVRWAAIVEAHLGDSLVSGKLVGVDDALRYDVPLNHRVNGFGTHIFDGPRQYLSLALNDSDNRSHSSIAAHRSPCFSLAPSAVVSLVDLHRRPLQLQFAIREKRANAIKDAPRTLVSDASLALNLLCGDAAASRTHEVHRIEPSLERSRGLLKDGSLERVEVMSAMVARKRGAIAYAVVLAGLVAFHARGNAIRPAFFHNVAQAGVIVRKLVVEVFDAVAQMLWDALFDFHISLTRQSISENVLVVKRYLPHLEIERQGRPFKNGFFDPFRECGILKF